MVLATHAAAGAYLGKRWGWTGVALAVLTHPILDRLDNNQIKGDWLDGLFCLAVFGAMILILRKDKLAWLGVLSATFFDLEHIFTWINIYLLGQKNGAPIHEFIHFVLPWPAWLMLPANHLLVDGVGWGLALLLLWLTWRERRKRWNAQLTGDLSELASVCSSSASSPASLP